MVSAQLDPSVLSECEDEGSLLYHPACFKLGWFLSAGSPRPEAQESTGGGFPWARSVPVSYPPFSTACSCWWERSIAAELSESAGAGKQNLPLGYIGGS